MSAAAIDATIENARESIDDLSEATRVVPLGDGVFGLRIAEGWRQGRGAFGGIVMGALARAIGACEEDTERVFRTLTGAIAAPAMVGDATIEVIEMRRGSAVSTFDATLLQNGEILARATAVLGRVRRDARRILPDNPPPPPASPWADLNIAPLRAPFAPEFAQHFEFRPLGALPFTGAQEPTADGYVRPRRCASPLGAPEIVALADAWWPASFAIEPAARPIATVAFTIQFSPSEAPLLASSPLRHRARAVAAQDGYVVEFRELWTGEGALVALNQQTFVVIR